MGFLNEASYDQENERVAVIMAVYNEIEPWVRASIESILNQTHNNLHLYIVLDNPHNHILESVIDEYARSDNRISYFVNERNLGLVKSLNCLLDNVDEEYVARMDADDVSYPNRIEKELKFLHEYDLDFVMSGDDLISEDGVVTPGRLLPLYLTNDMREVQKYANVSTHPTWLLKSKVYRELGGYRDIESCEDLDFVLRALEWGFGIGRMPDALIQYRLRCSGISYTKSASQYARARFLHALYRSGASMKDPAVQERANSISVALSPKDLVKAESARRSIDELSMCLYERKWLQCFKIVFPEIVLNKFFRGMFMDGISARMRISKYGMR